MRYRQILGERRKSRAPRYRKVRPARGKIRFASLGAFVSLVQQSPASSVHRHSWLKEWLAAIEKGKVIYSPFIANAWVRSLDIEDCKD